MNAGLLLLPNNSTLCSYPGVGFPLRQSPLRRQTLFLKRKKQLQVRLFNYSLSSFKISIFVQILLLCFLGLLHYVLIIPFCDLPTQKKSLSEDKIWRIFWYLGREALLLKQKIGTQFDIGQSIGVGCINPFYP